MRLRIVRVPDNDNVTDEQAFGDDFGSILPTWQEGIVIMLGNKCAPDQVTVFTNGESHWYDENGSFTPRVEDWNGINVVVLHDEIMTEG